MKRERTRRLFRELGPAAGFFFCLLLWPAIVLAAASVTATVTPSPLKVKIAAPGVVEPGELFVLEGKISNESASAVTKSAALLEIPSGLEFAGRIAGRIDRSEPGQRILGTLAPGGSRVTNFPILAGPEGNYVVLLSAAGIHQATGQVVRGEAAAVIEVTSASPGWLARIAGLFGRIRERILGPRPPVWGARSRMLAM